MFGQVRSPLVVSQEELTTRGRPYRANGCWYFEEVSYLVVQEVAVVLPLVLAEGARI